LVTNHCPHFEDTPIGELCNRCEQEGVGIVELDADGEGVVIFLVPISQGFTLQELRKLGSQEAQDEALVRRKLMTEEELEEAMLEPFEEAPRQQRRIPWRVS
jgi:bifunctional DNA-binding transcriptional regulator/antitoxin component of YhaV-PrlF toxin-antitoxin module